MIISNTAMTSFFIIRLLRINKNLFLSFLFIIYLQLLKTNSSEDSFEKPTYFQLLTCMMLHAFVQEKVDVAVVEVGIGGEYDYTNIIP